MIEVIKKEAIEQFLLVSGDVWKGPGTNQDPDFISSTVESFYEHFEVGAKKYEMDLKEQFNFLSLCITESSGFQKPEEPDPSRIEGESDFEYEERICYKGRGFIRLTGRQNYKDADEALSGFHSSRPDKVGTDLETNMAASLWGWRKKQELIRKADKRDPPKLKSDVVEGGGSCTVNIDNSPQITNNAAGGSWAQLFSKLASWQLFVLILVLSLVVVVVVFLRNCKCI